MATTAPRMAQTSLVTKKGSLKVSTSSKKVASTIKAKKSTTTAAVVYKGPREVEKIVRSYFKNTPLLAEIASCESHFHQYTTDGEVFRGKINSSDVGVMQINEKYHLRTAKRMGIDLHSLDGNLAYAKYLYNREGLVPWAPSGSCWDKMAVNLSVTSKN